MCLESSTLRGKHSAVEGERWLYPAISCQKLPCGRKVAHWLYASALIVTMGQRNAFRLYMAK